MDAPENSDAFSLDEIRAVALDRVREEQEVELRQREAEQRDAEQRDAELRARDEEQQRRAIEDERRREAGEARRRAEAQLKAQLEHARTEPEGHAIPSLTPRFPIAWVVAGTLLAVAAGLAMLLLHVPKGDRGAPPPGPGISAQLEAQRSSLALERATERAGMEARIRALEGELGAARQQVAAMSAALSVERQHRASSRSARAEVVAAAAAEPSRPEPTAISASKIDTSVTDPLAGLDLD